MICCFLVIAQLVKRLIFELDLADSFIHRYLLVSSIFLSVKFSGKPTYSTRRRKSVSKPKASSLFPRTSSEPQLSVQLSDSSPPSPGSSTHSVPSTTTSETASVDEHNITMNGDIDTYKQSEKTLNRTLSVSSTASDSSYSGSDSGELSPREERRKKRSWHQYSMPNISEKPVVPPVKVVSGAATIRKRLYASVPGKRFVAVRDYQPLMAGELALEKGDEVEGTMRYAGDKIRLDRELYLYTVFPLVDIPV